MGNPPPPGKHPDLLGEILDEKTLADEVNKAIQGTDCPGDDELRSFSTGGMDESGRSELKTHLAGCKACALRMAEIGPPGSTGVPQPPRPAERGSKGFRGFRLAPPNAANERRRRRPVLLYAGGFLGVLVIAYLLLGRASETSLGVKVVSAADSGDLRAGEKAFIEVHPPNPVYLIEITVDGKGKVSCRIPTGPSNGTFADGDRLEVSGLPPGPFDLYLVPCLSPDGPPRGLLQGLHKLISNESPSNRQEQRKGIEKALGLYRVRFHHSIHSVSS